jgi:uncharacterized protein (TIGR03435 family)
MKLAQRIACVCLLSLTSVSLLAAQATAAPKEFDVATIKPSAPLDLAKLAADVQAGKMPHLGAFVDASHAEYVYMSLKALLAEAYKLKDYQITGPDWLATEHFDINAKLPEGATKDDVPALLQALLADRFKLTAHKSIDEHKVLALIIGKNGAKLKVSPPDPAPAADAPLKSGETELKGKDGALRIKKNSDGSVTMDMGEKGIITQRVDMQEQSLHLDSSKVTMDGFAEMLTKVLQMGGGKGRQVVDQTGLKGNFQVAIDLSLADLMAFAKEQAKAMGMSLPPGAGGADSALPAAPSGGTSIYASVEKLGLKLEERKLPVEQLVIDHIEKTPTAN